MALWYILKKVASGIIVVFAVSILLFLFMHLLPADPITLLTAGQRVSQQRLAELRGSWGLDQPLQVQYFYWLSHIVQGDFGTSYVVKLPVSDVVFPRIPLTLLITLPSLIISYVLGLAIGVVAALKRDTLLERLTMGSSIFLYSIPEYWLGAVLMLVLGFYLGIFPISGYGTVNHLIMPILTLSLPSIAIFARLTRTEVLEVIREDYVRTASAKGLPARVVILRHILRNALISVTVLFFLYLPWTIGGAVIVETIFAYPGMGNLLYHSILLQDYTVVLAIIFIITILTVISNTVGDILTAIIDPRVGLEG